MKDLVDKGLARESDGAICVFLDGQPTPMIVQKQDGAFLYATTDLATIQYRMAEWQPDAILYVVDHRQRCTSSSSSPPRELWGYGDVELQHVSFGTVLGDDGRPFKTRSGTPSAWRACSTKRSSGRYAIVCQNDDSRPDAATLRRTSAAQVAERIGIGAIKYADLSQNRTSDYVFSYDKMLAMNGNTATYMQYSYARVRSIFAKAGVDESAIRIPRLRQSAISLATPQERALGLSLLQFAEALDRVVADYRPNHLTAYLFELASRYSEFFENCPVLKAETDELRTSRLAALRPHGPHDPARPQSARHRNRRADVAFVSRLSHLERDYREMRVCSAELRKRESSPRLRYLAAQFSRRFEPLVDDRLHVCQRVRISFTVRGAAWQLGNFGNHGLIRIAPIKNDLVARVGAHSSSPARRYFKINPRTCFTW